MYCRDEVGKAYKYLEIRETLPARGVHVRIAPANSVKAHRYASEFKDKVTDPLNCKVIAQNIFEYNVLVILQTSWNSPSGQERAMAKAVCRAALC
jgi:hypothetical protein